MVSKKNTDWHGFIYQRVGRKTKFLCDVNSSLYKNPLEKVNSLKRLAEQFKVPRIFFTDNRISCFAFYWFHSFLSKFCFLFLSRSRNQIINQHSPIIFFEREDAKKWVWTNRHLWIEMAVFHWYVKQKTVISSHFGVAFVLKKSFPENCQKQPFKVYFVYTSIYILWEFYPVRRNII